MLHSCRGEISFSDMGLPSIIKIRENLNFHTRQIYLILYQILNQSPIEQSRILPQWAPAGLRWSKPCSFVVELDISHILYAGWNCHQRPNGFLPREGEPCWIIRYMEREFSLLDIPQYPLSKLMVKIIIVVLEKIFLYAILVVDCEGGAEIWCSNLLTLSTWIHSSRGGTPLDSETAASLFLSSTLVDISYAKNNQFCQTETRKIPPTVVMPVLTMTLSNRDPLSHSFPHRKVEEEHILSELVVPQEVDIYCNLYAEVV